MKAMCKKILCVTSIVCMASVRAETEMQLIAERVALITSSAAVAGVFAYIYLTQKHDENVADLRAQNSALKAIVQQNNTELKKADDDLNACKAQVAQLTECVKRVSRFAQHEHEAKAVACDLKNLFAHSI